MIIHNGYCLKTAFILMAALAMVGCAGSHPLTQADSFLAGRWIGTTFNRSQDSHSCPTVGWELTIRPDGTFSEYCDSGARLCYERSGYVAVSNDTLSFYFDDMDESWNTTFKYEDGMLNIFAPKVLGWNAELRKSTDTIATLHALPPLPQTVEEAVDLVISELSESDRDYIARLARQELIGELHFSLGLFMRNRFLLWNPKSALRNSCGGSDIHPDAASTVLITAIWTQLRRSYDPVFLSNSDLMYEALRQDTVFIGSLDKLPLKTVLERLTQSCLRIIHSEPRYKALTDFSIILSDSTHADSLTHLYHERFPEYRKYRTMDIYLGQLSRYFDLEIRREPPKIFLSHRKRNEKR